MPIYEYACKSCEHTFDALQKMSDPKLVDCPECGEASLRKLLSAPKFRLAGKGWYETDFKTGDKRNIAGESDKKPDTKTPDTSNAEPAKAEPKKTEPKKAEPKTMSDSKAAST